MGILATFFLVLFSFLLGSYYSAILKEDEE